MASSVREARVVCALEVSLPEGVSDRAPGPNDGTLEYSVIAVDLKKGKSVKQFTDMARVLTHPPVSSGVVTIQLPAVLTLPPGEYQLRASATIGALGTGGSVYLAFDVPDLQRGPLVMSSVIIGYSDGGRMTDGAALSRTPDASPLPFAPSLDRVFRATDSLRVYFEAVSRPTTSVRALVDLLDATGRVVRSIGVPIVSSRERQIADVAVSLSGLPAGSYVLRAMVTGQSGQTVHRDIGFAIRSGDSSGADRHGRAVGQ
jgi:hypothetical protein